MKTALAIITLALFANELRADEPKPKELLVAAVGDIPVPRLKVVEEFGFRGYKRDEDSSPLVFPAEWMIEGADLERSLALKLNREPLKLAIKSSNGVIGIKPGGEDAEPKPMTAGTTKELEMLVLFNRVPDKPWIENFGTSMAPCVTLNPDRPMAVLLNLSGATLQFMDAEKKTRELAPGKKAVAPILVNRESGASKLALVAHANGKPYDLSLYSIGFSGKYCPVVVVYTAINSAKSRRPLKVAVLQPSQAVTFSTDPLKKGAN